MPSRAYCCGRRHEDNQAHWISNADTPTPEGAEGKHILVVADSCYSGTLARSANISLHGVDYIERIVKKKARTVLTSGGLEPAARCRRRRPLGLRARLPGSAR